MGYEGQDFSDVASGVSPAFIEALYAKYQASPSEVERVGAPSSKDWKPDPRSPAG